jgi:hypothetical protein
MLLPAASAVGFVFAQGWSGNSHLPTFDSKKRPPLALPQAYAVAERHIGPATNRFFCVTATCVDSTNTVSTGWSFGFSDTNGSHATVKVLFNTEVWIDEHSATLLK